MRTRGKAIHSSPCITVSYRQVIAYTGVGYCAVYLFLRLTRAPGTIGFDSTLSFCLNLAELEPTVYKTILLCVILQKQ